MYSIKFKVLNKTWTLKVLDKQRYKKKIKKYGESVALTVAHKKTVYLSPFGVDLETIVHELVHVYMYETCISSMDYDAGELEEFFCELMSRRGYELLDLGNTLHGKIAALRKQDETT